MIREREKKKLCGEDLATLLKGEVNQQLKR